MSTADVFSCIVFRCSKCHHVNTMKSRLKVHQERSARCAQSTIETVKMFSQLPNGPDYDPDAAPPNVVPLIVSGVDKTKETIPERNERLVYEYLASKVPSGFCDEEDDRGLRERIDYLCADEQADLRKKLFARVRCGPAKVGQKSVTYPPVDISVRLLYHLWGVHAPEKFRSIVFTNRMIHDLQANESPGDPAGVVMRKYVDPQERTELVIGVYIALLEVADCVIDRCADCAAEAYRDALRGTGKMTTLDVFEKNRDYENYRRKDPFRVKVANAFRREILAALHETKLKNLRTKPL